MAATEIILGNNANFYIGTNLVACAKSVKVSVSVEAMDAQCVGTGSIKKKLPGDKEVKWSCDGLFRQYDSTDEATNQTVNDWFDGAINNTELTIKFQVESTVTGAKKYTITGYADSVEMSAQQGAVATFTASGWGNTFAIASTT